MIETQSFYNIIEGIMPFEREHKILRYLKKNIPKAVFLRGSQLSTP